MSETVAAMVAYHRAGPWVRRCVESVLAQTYPHLRCYVVNDADGETPPWPMLADITDPRLVRFDLPENRGRYFCDAVVLAASPDAFWALCDPDDWSEPDRFAELVPIAAEHGSAQAPHLLYPGSSRARPTVRATRMRTRPGAAYTYHAGYASAVTTTASLRAIGGFHAGMRTTYDTYVTRATKLLGFGTHRRAFTHKLRRPGSLMTSRGTRPGSDARLRDVERCERLWGRAWALHGQGRPIAGVVRRDIPKALRDEVEHHAARLRELIP